MNRNDALLRPQSLIPRRPVPSLEIETVDGPTWRLADQEPENFTLLVFYRGLHCPICKPYLRQLERKLPELKGHGVEVIAVSSDTADRAKRTKKEWDVPNLTIGYGLGLDEARGWGLYVSEAISEDEPERFTEPALILVRPDGTLYFSAVQSMPFARPEIDAVVNAIGFVIEKNYPARGEVLDEATAGATV